MKTFFKSIFMIASLILATLSFNSCLNDDDAYSLGDMWISIATARPLGNDSFYLTLDDSTTMWPAAPGNIFYQPTKPQRVQINYTILGDNFQGYDHAIKVNRIDTILTKTIAPNLGIENDSIYGNDPVDITAMWIGDGFLNVEFKTYYSGNVKHFINLLHKKESSISPYKFAFRHNAYSDKDTHFENKRYGLVAFDLSDLSLPSEETTLYIDVNTYDGIKTFELKHNSGKAAKEPILSANNNTYIN